MRPAVRIIPVSRPQCRSFAGLTFSLEFPGFPVDPFNEAEDILGPQEHARPGMPSPRMTEAGGKAAGCLQGRIGVQRMTAHGRADEPNQFEGLPLVSIFIFHNIYYATNRYQSFGTGHYVRAPVSSAHWRSNWRGFAGKS